VFIKEMMMMMMMVTMVMVAVVNDAVRLASGQLYRKMSLILQLR